MPTRSRLDGVDAGGFHIEGDHLRLVELIDHGLQARFGEHGGGVNEVGCHLRGGELIIFDIIALRDFFCAQFCGEHRLLHKFLFVVGVQLADEALEAERLEDVGDALNVEVPRHAGG